MRRYMQRAVPVMIAAGIMAGCCEEKPAAVEPPPSTGPTAAAAASVQATETPSSPSPTAKQQIKVVIPEEQVEVINLEVKDIAGHPVQKEITQMIESGAVKLGADGLFKPNNAITRAEFITWMYRYDSKGIKPHRPDQPSFSDVLPENPHYDMVEGLKAAGLITGFPDGTMKLEKELTREELTLLWGWFEQRGDIVKPHFDNADFVLGWYVDGKSVTKVFRLALAKYLDEGYMKTVFGDTAKINPQQSVTRAEAAQWIVYMTETKEKRR